MKNVLFLSSWYPSRVHNTLGNFVRYHALASSKYNSINVLYIVADDKVKNYEIDYFKDHEIATTIVYFKRGIFKYLNYFIAFIKGFNFLTKKKSIKFDIVHMNIMHPGIWQALFLKSTSNFLRKLTLKLICSIWRKISNAEERLSGRLKPSRINILTPLFMTQALSL